MKIADIEGIGPAYAEKLIAAGIEKTEQLLAAGAEKKGRKGLAEATGINEKLILGWVNRADLMRVKGIGTQYSDLLEASGVDTVAELAHRNAANLLAHMLEVNLEKQLVRRPPTAREVESWVAAAKTLDRVVNY